MNAAARNAKLAAGAVLLAVGAAAGAPTIVRQDKLVLKTMNREQLLAFILDGLEDALPELEALWVDEPGKKGTWKHTGKGRSLAFGGYDVHYAVLLTERPKTSYCGGRYSRELLLTHCNPASFSARNVYRDYLGRRARGQTPAMPAGKARPLPTRAQRHEHFRHLRDTVKSQGYDSLKCPGWGGREFANNLHDYGAFNDGHRVYPDTSKDWRQTDAYVGHLYSWMSYYSTAQDRAVRWAGADGLSLAEVSEKLYPNHHPDFSAEHHGTTTWAYIIGGSAQGGRPNRTLFAAAVSGRRRDELIEPLRAADHPDLARLAGYTRRFLRNVTAPEGSAMWPMSSEAYENRITDRAAFTLHFAYDATVNRNPESAAYLSRAVQKAVRCIKSPLPACVASGPYYRTALTETVAAYYMVKHWGLPAELPSWEDVQDRDGGATFFRYQDWYVHRNRFKTLTFRTAHDPASDACGDRQIHCTYHPTPCKEGHGMDFLQPFRAFRYVRRVTPPLRNADRGAPVFGDYGQAGRRVVAQPWGAPSPYGKQRCRASDGGVNVALLQTHPKHRGTVKRALLSLGGRLTAVLEQSPTPGRFVPFNFLVRNIDGYSAREGRTPIVRWTITTPDGPVAFADLQRTDDDSTATVSPSTRWYDIDDFHAVAVAKPLPLKLAPVQFNDVRDTLFFGPSAGGAAVIYSGVGAGDMPRLAKEVRLMAGLPAGLTGLEALAPEGYRVFALANVADGKAARYRYAGATPQGAPVFSVPTEVGPAGKSVATFEFEPGPDVRSEEPRFYVARLTGAKVRAAARYHRLEMTARGGPATVTVRFFSATRTGPVGIEGTSGAAGRVDAAVLRDAGLTLKLKADQAVWLSLTGTADRDRLGPFVDITAPRWRRDTRPAPKEMGSVRHGHFGRWEPIRGRFTFKADAADRSGVAKVEFYLNNGRLIGTDTEAPYECAHEIKDTFCQYVYAVATDTLGNKRRSFVVPFGDGTIGPSMMADTRPAPAGRGAK